MYGGFYDEKVRSFDCLSRVDLQVFAVTDTVSKNVASAKDINVYVEQRVDEDGQCTTKFGLENVPFKLSKCSSVRDVQNLASK